MVEHSPVIVANLPIGDKQPLMGGRSAEKDKLMEHSPVVDVQSPAADKKSPVRKQCS